MQGIIGLEEQLSNLAEILETEGYEVVTLDENTMKNVDVIIIGSNDSKLPNIDDATVGVPIIHAIGKTYSEIVNELELM